MKSLKITNLLLIATVLFINYSCSVEKKLYSHGYYVKWHHSSKNMKAHNSHTYAKSPNKISKVTPKQKLPTLAFNDDEFSVLHKSESGVIITQIVDESDESLLQVSAEPAKPKLRYKEVIKGVQMANNLANNVIPVEGGQRTHGLAVAGFVLALAAWIMPLNLALILLLLGVIFAIIALVKISKNPEVYKGSGLAIAAFVIALVGLVVLFAI